MKVLNYVAAIFFLTSLSVASAGTPDLPSSTDPVDVPEVAHVDGMDIEHPEELGELAEVGEHPDMAEVEDSHGPETEGSD